MVHAAARLPNPLVPGWNPDPSCTRVGDTYYLVTSTFEYLPGLPVYASQDLLTWTHVSNVITRSGQAMVAQVPSGGGVWAPTIRERDGRFFVIVSIAGSPRGCVVFTAEDPTGPWSDGVELPGVYGIDPDLAWDRDGIAHVTFSGLHVTETTLGPHDGIMQLAVDLGSGASLGEPISMWSGTGRTAPEAPHVYERDGWFYLVIAEGGTTRGHAVSVARSRSISGPYVGAPHNPILTSAGTDRPIQCTGHADLVAKPDGNDFMVLLGTRAVDGFGSFSPLGRETFATAVEWRDGWPHADVVDLEPSLEPVVEEFDLQSDAPFADPGWLAVRRTPTQVCSQSDLRGAVLTGGSLLEVSPAFVGRRQKHMTAQFVADVDVSQGAGGLALRFDEQAHISLVARGVDAQKMEVTATFHLASGATRVSVEVPGSLARLHLETAPPAASFPPWAQGGDVITLAVTGPDGQRCDLGDVDGRGWCMETAAPFTGRIVGLLAESGEARFLRLSYAGFDGA